MTPPLVFTDAAALLLAGGSINLAVAVRLELPGETLNLALGQGSIVTNDGARWDGLGDLGAIDGLDFGPRAASETITMTLSGLNADLARLAREDSREIRGSRVSVYALLFDAKGQPVDLPYLCQMAIIDRASLKRSGATYVMEVTAEPLFASKHIPPLNLVTDADQRAKWPGDRIFDRAAYQHTIFWG
ncbi:MAG: hypothetical protein FJX45_12260 [Alphaproteobacteria bacterium]|nr:hypothetical protein [Alphaproteobacteria bacterium]MBM3654320.1 hypothetical protein [Alphaproteobacteria bacterium]